MRQVAYTRSKAAWSNAFFKGPLASLAACCQTFWSLSLDGPVSFLYRQLPMPVCVNGWEEFSAHLPPVRLTTGWIVAS